MGKAENMEEKKRKRHKKRILIRKCIPLYLMLIPGIIYAFINNYIPMAGIVVAFKKYNVRYGIFGSPWTGLSNFTYLFKTDAYILIRNTLLYNIAFIVVNLFFGVAVAVMISDVAGKIRRKIYQSAILFPFLVSMVIVSYIVYAFLSVENGLVNNGILKKFGADAINWYSETKYWPFILIFVNTWKNLGYGCLLYIAAIAGIDKEMFEAARLDGASKLQEIGYITIPNLVPTMITVVLLNVGRIFYSDFGLFYQIPQNSGALYNVTNTIDTYVYRAMMSNGGLGRSSAAGVFQSVIGFLLILLANSIVRKFSKENAIF